MRRTQSIVHVTSVHGTSDPRIFEKMCTSLTHAGHAVTLISTGEAPPDSAFPVIVYRRSDSRPWRMTVGAGRAMMRAASLRPKLVHLHDPELLPWGFLLKLFGSKVVYDAHEDLPATIEYKPYLAAPLKRIALLLSRCLIRVAEQMADAIVTATPSIASTFNHSRVEVIQNFPKIADWHVSEPSPSQSSTLVYIGGISEGRGVWQMMDVLVRLGETRNATLKLAGPIAPSLLSSLEQHPGWRFVEYLGVLDRKSVSDLVADSTIGLVLFLPEPNHVNSQPTKLFEYMAAGIPIIASDYPLWRQLVVDTEAGLVADPTDIDAISTAAEYLIDNPQVRSHLGASGRRAVLETLNWDVEARKLYGLYADLLADQPIA